MRNQSLRDYVEDATSMSLDDFVTAHAPGFLLCRATMGFLLPHSPKETISIPLGDVVLSTRSEFPADTVVFPLKSGPNSKYRFISLGRTSNCDVTLPHDSVSKIHTIFRTAGDGFTIEDADSRNGTLVDGEYRPTQGDPLLLRDGAVVQIGSVKVHYLSGANFYDMARGVEVPRMGD